MTSRDRRSGWSIALCALAVAVWSGPARGQQPGLRLRTSVGIATLTSEDQLDRLEYDRLGLVGDFQVGHSLTTWFDLQAGFLGGAFLSSTQATGGLFAPHLGFRIQLPIRMIRPYLQLDGGLGFTGHYKRPMYRVAAGVDIQTSQTFALGPMVGYARLIQWNLPGFSSDPEYLWLGVSMSYHPVPARARRKPPPDPVRTEVVREVVREVVQLPPPDRSPSELDLPREPSPEVLELIERALPATQRVELLAPVLFEFDSDGLKPEGVALLHEIAQALEEREDIELVEIRGYSDRRGDAAHNRALAARRAERVRAWLIERGIAPERLQAAAAGSTAFVEDGDDEASHQQNRRVVFRVLRLKETPQ